MTSNIPNVLVHVCCAPCAIYPFDLLHLSKYNLTGFFYNPNIYPNEEYIRRKIELVNYFSKNDFKLIINEKSSDDWYSKISGHEHDREKGHRCSLCFEHRLSVTAKYAKDNGYDAFTTVLTISPHKNSKIINELGKQIEEEQNIKFLEENFKKNDGFKKSLELSANSGLYRQNYCGCKFSIR